MLVPRIVGMRIEDARLIRRDVLVAPGDPAGGFARQRSGAAVRPARVERLELLEGCEVVEVLRRGKQLALVGREAGGAERVLLVQLGMTGQVLLEDEGAEPCAHTHVHAVWTLRTTTAGGMGGRDCVMRFRDPRRFGGLRVVGTRDDLAALWAELGPDALEVTAEDVLRIREGSSRAIKALLLDQCAIAGVGNIYADEALFRAGIRPSRRARTLKRAEAGALAEAIRVVLGEAVAAGGSTIRDYRNAEGGQGEYQGRHAVYGRGGSPCGVCGRTLRRGILGQRTTVWCSGCQR
jgi:formamidopyrimidine-DNA glycosylase